MYDILVSVMFHCDPIAHAVISDYKWICNEDEKKKDDQDQCAIQKRHNVGLCFFWNAYTWTRLETFFFVLFFFLSFKLNRNLIWYLCVLKKNFLGTLSDVFYWKHLKHVKGQLICGGKKLHCSRKAMLLRHKLLGPIRFWYANEGHASTGFPGIRGWSI